MFRMLRRKKKKEVRSYELLSHKNPQSAMAEAYRTLRTNLGFASIDQPCRSILVSSTNPQDGKSLTIANLAVVMAQDGHKVLLADCDLRKPVQHRIFGVSNHRGITNYLMQQAEFGEVVQKSDIDNLDILTSGPIPPNPAEILNSERSRALWPALQQKYDYVLVDAPPVLAVTDAAILSTQVDGVILVVSAAGTRNELARQAKAQFEHANARLLGVILNKVKMDEHRYGYSYYYYGSEDHSS